MSSFLDHRSQRVLLCDGASRLRRAPETQTHRFFAR